MTTDAQYETWLLDVSRDPYRILLIELDHSAGTVHLASDWWMSDTLQPYDDWIQGEPLMQDTLDSFKSVGDVRAINVNVDDVDWLSLTWRGYRCRWYYGDKTWVKADFKQIATTLIDGCRKIDGNLRQFDLVDGGQHLNQTFTTSMTSTISVPSTIELISTAAGLPSFVIFTNVSDIELSSYVNVTYDANSIALDEIRKLTDSIGAYTRMSQTGQLEVFIPEITASPRLLSADDIVYGSVKMVEQIPAYYSVTAKLFDDTEVSALTGAATGEYVEDIEYSTVLRVVAHATYFLGLKQTYHAVKHDVYQLEILDIAGFLQVGDDVEIQHPELNGVGIVSSIDRAPLSLFSIIEVSI